jgi:hypothetical protein
MAAASATATREALMPSGRTQVAVLAYESGLHPDLVARFLRLGVVEPVGSRYPSGAAARLARTERLRHDLGLNCQGALLALDLLARIDDLEARLRRYER